MTLIDATKAIATLAKGRYVCVNVHCAFHNEDSYDISWQGYVDGYSYTQNCKDFQELCKEIEKMLTMGQDVSLNDQI